MEVKAMPQWKLANVRSIPFIFAILSTNIGLVLLTFAFTSIETCCMAVFAR
jgi:hypothetical protein